MSEKFYTREEAAKYINSQGLPITKLFLAKLATVGGGPEFRRFGRYTVYERVALDKWIETRLSAPMTSTSAVAPNIAA